MKSAHAYGLIVPLLVAACNSPESEQTAETAITESEPAMGAEPETMESEPTEAAQSKQSGQEHASTSTSKSPATFATNEPKVTTKPDEPARIPIAQADSVTLTQPPGFATCKACHSVDKGGVSGVGPNLHGVFGRQAGAKAGYIYSEAMNSSGIVWTRGNLEKYLADPAGTVPGTRMAIPGVVDTARRAKIIDYLEKLK